MKKRRIFAIFMATIVFVSGCISISARETDFFEENFVPVPFDREWGDADRSEFDEIYKKLEIAIEKENNAAEVISLCDELEKTAERIQTEANFCSLDYYRDSESYSEANNEWSNMLIETVNDAMIIYQKVLASDYEDSLREFFGNEYCDYIMENKPDTEYELTLLEKELELVDRYQLAMGTYDTYSLNKEVAPILAELIKVRNEYAKSKGYENYAYYAYEVIYDRDFKPDEVQNFYEEVKEYFVPLQEIYNNMIHYNSNLDFYKTSSLWGLSEDEIIEVIEPWMDDVSDEYLRAYEYMKEYKLYDIGYLETKLDVGFTTFFSQYDSAYIFSSPTGTSYDVSTQIHEFGHFANSVLTGDGASMCYDISEIHSQGLEMLYMHYADQLVGEGGGDAYRANGLSNMIYSLVEGALYDECQQVIYSDGDMTAEEINKTFKRISEEYGYTYWDNDEEAYDWVLVNHTFASPFYYISYATSALGAMEILSISNEDFEKGADVYLSLASQCYVGGYKEAVSMAGLSNVFDEGVVKEIAEDMEKYAYDNIADVTFGKEIENHWAEEYLKQMGLYGIFKGDEGGKVNPDREMTVAEAITVLWRMEGSPNVYTDSMFVDVQYTDWYFDAVEWFVSVLQEDEKLSKMNYSGYFGANERVSRSMFVWMYHMVNHQITPANDYLSEFSDGDKVPQNTKTAMNWAIESGIIQGRDDGTLDPEGYLTRAEIAKILS